MTLKLTKKCFICNRTFEKPKSCGLPEWKNRRITCSVQCCNEWKKDKHFSMKTQFSKERHYVPPTAIKEGQRLSPKTEFKKGHKTWNKGLKGFMEGEKNACWKGEEAAYGTKHTWMRNNFGRASECEVCGATKIPKGYIRFFQWANLSHQYKRIREDWMQICVPCHIVYDKKFKN